MYRGRENGMCSLLINVTLWCGRLCIVVYVLPDTMLKLSCLSGKLQCSLPYVRGTSRNLATFGGGEVWRSEVKPQSELNEEIQKTRLKDMPVYDMQNPFEREKAQCILCQYKIVPDYKNVKLLSQFVSPYTGRIYGRHITRLCATQQARLEREIIKSQSAGFMPYYFKDIAFVKDPKLFDPDRPIRPHRF